jgi:hypothetical protein
VARGYKGYGHFEIKGELSDRILDEYARILKIIDCKSLAYENF